MGEAKRRGTFEQRKVEGIIKREAEIKAMEEKRKRCFIAHKPSQNTMALATILSSTEVFKYRRF